MNSPEKISTIKELRRLYSPLKNTNIIHYSLLNTLDKLALFVTEKIGTMRFFLFILFFNAAWIGWNIFASKDLIFDPAFNFLILLFINNILQILFLPLIMVGQNIQAKHSELRAEQDFETGKKAEKEIETILLHLENQQKLIESLTHSRR